jgi:NCS1 family nucleobase:cation symporter-1
MCPWYWLSTFGNYVFGWLVGYSGLLGPVAGIMVTDYFLIRHTRLDTYSLYRRGGIYEYRNGFNPRAIVALICGVVVALIGRFVPALAFLYGYAWFVGFFVAGGVYYLLMVSSRSRNEHQHHQERKAIA